ncbi:hypothetical protein HKX48_004840 [Thoreauomyces humboldtii]|nr:hypothetical protein HKX48_004840 [Thoreauomyces humboldtii]
MTTSAYAPLARENRFKVLKNLADQGATGTVYLRGMPTTERKWTDCEIAFRQESNFFYLTGVTEPDCHVVIDIASKESTLIIPKYSEDHALWCGAPPTIQDVKAKYGFDHAKTVEDVETLLAHAKSSKIHILEQEAELGALGKFKENTDISALTTAVTEARMIKSAGEVEIMRKAAKISGDAHVALMKAVGAGKGSELELHALFEYECFRQGGRFQAYTPIVASGRNGSVLHYIENTAPVATEPNDMLLVDAGCEVSCYASDITRTYPVGGTYSGDWKTTYEITLAMQTAVLSAMKPGVKWEDMHHLANRVAAEGLIKAGLIKGDLETLLANHIPAIFFPHGLGHSIGLDVHDVGGYPKGVERLTAPGIKYLRMRRTLEPGMAVTVEPGIYFVDPILDKALADPEQAKFLDVAVVERFRKTVGGVRIEDDVIITSSGIDNLTGWIPKEIADVEKLTYRWLSRKLEVNVNTAKRMLYDFYSTPRPTPIDATYYLQGQSADGEGTRCLVVEEGRLEEAKKLFRSYTIHIYSLQPCRLKGSEALRNVDFEVTEKDTLESMRKSRMIKNDDVQYQEKRVVERAKPAAKAEVRKPDATSHGQKEAARPIFEKSTTGTKLTRKGSANATDDAKARSTFFDGHAKKPAAPKKAMAKKSDGKAAAPTKNSLSTAQKIQRAEQQDALNKLMESDEEDNGDEEEREINELRRMASESSEVVVDDDDVVDVVADDDDEVVLEPDLMETDSQDVEEVAEPSAQGSRRVKKRRRVKKTRHIAAGKYMKTEDYTDWEEYSESEAEQSAPPPKRPKAAPPAQVVETESPPAQGKGKGGTKAPAKPAAKKGGKKPSGQQSTLLSFFGKK